MPTTTLDAERTDRLRSYLVAEAAASVAESHVVHLVPRSRPARRVAVAAAAVVVVGGAVFAGSAVVGGPGAVEPAAAVAFQEDGAWTTIRLTDPDADPQAVLDQLRAAGFDARLDTFEVTVTEGPNGQQTVSMEDPRGVGGGAGVTFTSLSAGAQGLMGLSVEFPDSAGEPPAPEGFPALGEPIAGSGGAPVVGHEHEDWYEENGIRFELDGSFSLRADADLTVLVFARAG
jgi:hypothetical protein